MHVLLDSMAQPLTLLLGVDAGYSRKPILLSGKDLFSPLASSLSSIHDCLLLQAIKTVFDSRVCTGSNALLGRDQGGREEMSELLLCNCHDQLTFEACLLINTTINQAGVISP